jgi:nucleotide-binding universal stress UspA family protein
MDKVAFHRILVATDGSEMAKAAAGIAIDLARRYGADLLVVAVAPLPPVLSTPNAPIAPVAVAESAVPYYRGLVDEVVAQAEAAGVRSVSGLCEEGVVVEELLAQVRAHGADLVVVGSRGLSAAKRLLLGSVSTALVTHSPCPVLVVHPTTTPPGPTAAH